MALEARILAVADAYEAMVTDRPYRLGMSAREARAELRRCAGTQFDPDVVEAFLGTLDAPEDLGTTPPRSAPPAPSSSPETQVPSRRAGG